MGITEEQAVPEWLRRHYELVDAADLDRYARDFTDDIEIRLGSAEAVRGSEAVRKQLAVGHQRGMRHVFERVWISGPDVIVQFSVTYTLDGGREVTVPVVSLIHRRENLIDRLQVFIDPTPLSGPAS
jgi:ketosteroid isomerase-like protein